MCMQIHNFLINRKIEWLWIIFLQQLNDEKFIFLGIDEQQQLYDEEI